MKILKRTPQVTARRQLTAKQTLTYHVRAVDREKRASLLLAVRLRSRDWKKSVAFRWLALMKTNKAKRQRPKQHKNNQ